MQDMVKFKDRFFIYRGISMESYKYMYLALFIISIVILKFYLNVYTKQHGTPYLAYGIFAAVTNLAYYLYSVATTTEGALYATIVVYAIGVFIPVVLLGMTLGIARMEDKLLKNIVYVIATLIAFSVLTTENSGLFYGSFSVDFETSTVDYTYGPAYFVYYAYNISIFLITIIIYFRVRKNPAISLASFIYIYVIGIILLIAPWITVVIPGDFDLYSVALVVIEIIMLALCRRVPLYDIDTVVTEAVEKAGETGIICFDNNLRLLGSNSSILRVFPEFAEFRIDKMIPDAFSYKSLLDSMIDECNAKGGKYSQIVEKDEDYYSIDVDRLIMKGKPYGYQLIVKDVTVQQRYLILMENFKKQLEEEVERKTKKIIGMQDTVLIGVAELIESRDNSTGGHIKRTSDIVSILTDELKKEEAFDVSPSFYSVVSKSAPLHDLGKIAVEDAILRKPGKFTDEEYQEMKKHADEGGIMVHKVLEKLNEPESIEIATNIAHYHHERWDGSGYPSHLEGEEIPLEARIMAVADVYDALVSKRYYKDAFDFDRAYRIVFEGFGTHFDPKLKECFVKCRPRIEEYYIEMDKDD